MSRHPIIYYVFGGSLAEKHIIYCVLTYSKKLFSLKLYENLIIYYVLEPPRNLVSTMNGKRVQAWHRKDCLQNWHRLDTYKQIMKHRV